MKTYISRAYLNSDYGFSISSTAWFLLNFIVGIPLLNVVTGKDVVISNFAYLICQIVEFDGEPALDRRRTLKTRGIIDAYG